MIRVESIHVEEFRGIRNLTLKFDGRNFGVCGPNGTGKSGVVDSLEFALTGDVSRLSGEGTGDVTLRKHGPHVDSRDRPDKARVALTAFIPSLNKRVTIDRTVMNANKPTITTDDPAVLAILAQVALHPEFVLSRRELISYVLTTPGNRSAEVQALLRLDQVEKVRGLFLKIANACARDVPAAESSQRRAAEALTRVLEIAQPTAQLVLAAANVRRETLGLPALAAFTGTTALTEGLSTGAVAPTSRIVKSTATADILALQEKLAKLTTGRMNDVRTNLIAHLTALATDGVFSSAADRDELLRSALELFEGEFCPVCDTSWTPDAFRERVEAKRAHLAEIAKKRTTLEAELEPLAGMVEEVLDAIRAVRALAPKTEPATDMLAFDKYRASLETWRKQLASFTPLSATIDALSRLGQVPEDVLATTDKIASAVSALPEPTAQGAARDYLVRGQEKLEEYREATRRLKKTRDRAATAKATSDAYTAAQTEALEGIYKQVQGQFSEYYRTINSDDEQAFTGRLVPSIGKLGFDVDFYGRGMFPPGAYHSEGHQDGMGLCLYLALMKHLLGDGFTFAVLDDVLMSVDAGHRREVCRLLKRHFPHTQFVLTTHDRIWLRHMKSESLIRSTDSVHFRSWDVSQGPTEWDALDVWQKIEADLKGDDVRSAAALLRNYLEYITGEICHWLRAPVEYRGDAQYQLGDLLPSATGQFNKLLKLGKAAAQSWGQSDIFAALNIRQQAFAALVQATNVEAWQVNPAVHFNNWENLGVQDFAPVVAAYKALIEAFSCPDCGGPAYVLPDRGTRAELKCDCGKLHINLKTKPATTQAA